MFPDYFHECCDVTTMQLCASVRKKGSTDHCPSSPLKGYSLCRQHARTRDIVLWSDANQSNSRAAIKCQAFVRGCLLRKRLGLAGPGVLCRKGLANEDDLETCETVGREHPLTYFAFEESGKVWWFHYGTLWRWCCRNADPVNPYTKVPLSGDTRRRLRAIWAYNRVHGIDNPREDATTIADRVRYRVNIMCQIAQDNGFGALDPNVFLELDKSRWITIFRMVRDDLDITLPKNMVRVREMMRRYVEYVFETSSMLPNDQCVDIATRVASLMMLYPKDPYIIVFTMLSALYRA